MGSIQIQTESLPLWALATLWIWAKSEELKNIIYFGVFTDNHSEVYLWGHL